MTRRLLALLFTALAVLAVTSAPASAQKASRDEILQDCADDGELSGSYSPKDIKDAKKNIPTDVDEYTDCRDVLNRASASNSGKNDNDGGSSGGSGGGGSSNANGGNGVGPDAATGSGGGSVSADRNSGLDGNGIPNGTRFNRPGDEELEKLGEIQQGAAPQATVNGRQVSSGGAPDTDGDGNGIPGSVLAVLVLLGLAGAAAAAYGTRSLMNRRSGGLA